MYFYNIIFAAIILKANSKTINQNAKNFLHNNRATSSKLNYMGTIFRFIVNVDDLNSNCIESSDIFLSGVSWRVQFCKRTNNDSNAVDFILSSTYRDNTVLWSCDTSIAVKLFHKNARDNEKLSLNIPKQAFNNMNSSYEIESVVNWHNFLEQYVQDNKATFEIELSTTPLRLKSVSDVKQIQSKFQVVLDNRNNLGEIIAPEVTVQGVKWRIHTRIQRNETICSHLQAVNIDPNWSYKVFAVISIVNKNGSTYACRFSHIFTRDSPDVKPQNVMIKNMQANDQYDNFPWNAQTILIAELGVDTPKPLWKPERTIKTVEEYNSDGGDGIRLPCSICSNHYCSKDIFATNCGHLYCRPCHAKKKPIACHTCKKSVYYTHPIYV